MSCRGSNPRPNTMASSLISRMPHFLFVMPSPHFSPCRGRVRSLPLGRLDRLAYVRVCMRVHVGEGGGGERKGRPASSPAVSKVVSRHPREVASAACHVISLFSGYCSDAMANTAITRLPVYCTGTRNDFNLCNRMHVLTYLN